MLDDPLGRASVQYNDWKGTVAMDFADHVDASSFQKVAESVLGERADDYLVVAFDYSVYGPSARPWLTLYLALRDEWNADTVRTSRAPVEVMRLMIEDSPQVDEFFRSFSKRFTMRLERKVIDSDGSRLVPVGNLDELEDLDPDDLDY